MRDADGAFRSDTESATLGQVDREIRHARDLADKLRENDQRERDNQAKEFDRRLVELALRLDERARTGRWQSAVMVLIGLLSAAILLLRHLTP